MLLGRQLGTLKRRTPHILYVEWVACLVMQAAVKPLNVLIKGSGLKGGGVAALPSLPPSSCDEEELNTNQMQRLKGVYFSSQCI